VILAHPAQQHSTAQHIIHRLSNHTADCPVANNQLSTNDVSLDPTTAVDTFSNTTTASSRYRRITRLPHARIIGRAALGCAYPTPKQLTTLFCEERQNKDPFPRLTSHSRPIPHGHSSLFARETIQSNPIQSSNRIALQRSLQLSRQHVASRQSAPSIRRCQCLQRTHSHVHEPHPLSHSIRQPHQSTEILDLFSRRPCLSTRRRSRSPLHGRQSSRHLRVEQ
jgi:hypothetical protein